MIELDSSLVAAAECAATGANIHSVINHLAKYKMSVSLSNKLSRDGNMERAEYYRDKASIFKNELSLFLAKLAQDKFNAAT